MQYNPFRKSLIAAVLVLTVIFTSVCSVGFVSAANSSLEDKKNEIQDTLNDLDEKLDKTRDDKAAAQKKAKELSDTMEEIEANMARVTNEIDAIDQEIKPLQERIDTISNEITRLVVVIQQHEKDIEQKEIEFNQLFEMLKQRLRALYIAGDASALEVLLTSSDVSDFLNRFELVKGVAEHDSNLMKQVKTLVEQIKDLKASLESQKTAQEQLKEEAEVQKTKLDAKKAQAQARKDELTADQEKYNKLIEESNELIKKLTNDEKNIIAEYIKNENALDAIDDQIKNVINSSGSSSSNVTTGGSAGNASTGSGSKISMIWPVQGCSTYISSGYGPRWGKIHRGIDITGGGIYGKNVVAAASGKVILALNTTTGYGRYVIVDHGNGVATLYGHCSQLKVSVGDYVSQGQTIALVGSTGNSTGPHLHFEVRINGERVNPMNYL